jgi:hypothetical protein
MAGTVVLIRPLLVMAILLACGACAVRRGSQSQTFAEGRVVDLADLSADRSCASAQADSRVAVESSFTVPWAGQSGQQGTQPTSPPSFSQNSDPNTIGATPNPDASPTDDRSLDPTGVPYSDPYPVGASQQIVAPLDADPSRGPMIGQTAGEFAIEPAEPTADQMPLYADPQGNGNDNVQGNARPGSESALLQGESPRSGEGGESIVQPPRYRSMPVKERLFGEIGKIRDDYVNYYSWRNFAKLAIGFSAGAALANTSMDSHFADWYQNHARSSGTNGVADFFRPFGEGDKTVPICIGVGLIGSFYDTNPLGCDTADFGYRTTRAYLVGAPPMVFMQYCTGASRPDERSIGSQWRPFSDSNGVSGHAFIGAVPFITAAKMTDDVWLKSAFYFGSTVTAWSRVNDNRHYLSQAWLGWWMAYLACDSIELTENSRYGSVIMSPVVSPDMTGVAILYQR